MSDTPDPFAARPYVPPNERDQPGEPDPAPDAGDRPAEAPASGPLTHRFEDEQRASQTPLTQTTATLPRTEPDPAPPAFEHSAPWEEKRGGNKLAMAVAVAVLGGAAGVGGAAAYEQFLSPASGGLSSIDAPADTGRPPQTAVEAVAAKVRPSVVQINFRAGDEGGSGTGIIISADGQILTNNHVVDAAADEGSLVAVFSDGTHAEARILGRDPETDLAVIKAKGKTGLTPAVLGSSANLRVGQGVVVVGSPYGLESTVTSGIVSALNRPVATSNGDDELIIPSFQSDAAINLGNSGGPVVDLEGRVVGVVAAIRASGEGGSIGLGFAIPIDLAKGVASHLVKGEDVQHAQIGVTVSPAVADDEITKIGAEIQSVRSGSGGQKAGLKKGDIIIAVDETPVASNDALVAAIRSYQPGQTVTITFQRDGETKRTKVTLDSDGGKRAE
jgi:putative serine protease PepD